MAARRPPLRFVHSIMKTAILKIACIVPLLLLTVVANGAQDGKLQRISFARGAYSKTVGGVLDKQHSSAYFIVRSNAGQKMSVKVWPKTDHEGAIPIVLVTTPSGENSGEKSMRFDTQKTETGDYRIRVATNLMASNGTHGTFLLKIWIR